MSGASAPAASPPRIPARLPLMTVAVFVLAAVTAGLVAGGELHRDTPSVIRPERPITPVTKAGVRVQPPVGWSVGGSAAVPGLERPLRLQNPGANTSAAIELLPAAATTLVPAALKDSAGSPETVRLGAGYEARRYRLSDTDGAMGVLYAAPTTAGIATIACVSGDSPVALDSCRSLAAAVAVPQAQRLAVGDSAGFYSRLPNVLHELDSARDDGGRALAAATRSAGQADAAARLARAHRTAAGALAPLTSTGDGVPAATVAALSTEASAYDELSSAARDRVARRYATARTAVARADSDLRRTVTEAAGAARTATSSAAQGVIGPARPSTRSAHNRPATPASGTGTSPGSTGLTILLIIVLCTIPLVIRGVWRELR